MAQIPDSMLTNLRHLIDAFAERSRESRGVNNDVAVAWSEAAADLAVAMTIN
jgi:hypothetical protein